MKNLVINIINFYQVFLSFDRGILAVFAPGGACKHSPSCSEYTKQVIDKFGIANGIKMGAKRVWSCR